MLNTRDAKSTSKEKDIAELLKDQISTLKSKLKSGIAVTQNINKRKKNIVRIMKRLEIIIEAKITLTANAALAANFLIHICLYTELNTKNLSFINHAPILFVLCTYIYFNYNIIGH